MFEPLPSNFSFPQSEHLVLEFWRKHDIFARSLEIRRGAPTFVFYEGPPTANGLPHPGHCLTRAMKDLFPRYKTMCGYLVERKAGWDTHGLPVEVEVCKELGIHTKEEIEAYGVENFVRRCIESVFRYTREWEEMTRRLGFWVNLEEAYVTYHQSYVESVWWSLKALFERGLLYQGHKVVWWWCQGGTALSAGEVGEGYRTVKDPSVYIRFPLVAQEPAVGPPHAKLPPGSKVSLLVWTTTPWTLVSNHFAAVGPDVDYSLVRDAASGEHYYVAAALVDVTADKVKRKLETVGTCKGAALVGLRYAPPFDCYLEGKRVWAGQRGGAAQPLDPAAAPQDVLPMGRKRAALKGGGEEAIGWRVVPADFIDLETGTGIVHIAPAYGEVDFNLLLRERTRFVNGDSELELLNAVAANGHFNDEAPPPYRGRWVKDCDAEIIQELKGRGLLLHQETIEHEYPFCPRAEDDPLIQYARRSWFVRTSAFKEEFLKNNAAINWLPEHIREGRFGDFLRNNVDWALSRERYWGTPLPIWVCEQCGRMEAIGSFEELRGKPGATDATPECPDGFWITRSRAAAAAGRPLLEHLKVHKPYIDEWTYECPQCRASAGSAARRADQAAGPRMRRVPEVIDCWWDAGSMPFAQWGFPHAPGSVERFRERFPCDFISEAIDQTRGWFYGLLAISTLLFAERAPDAGSAGVPPAYPRPYRTCIVLGHVMGEDGLKMSKRTKNYREPSYVFEHYGADAMRWFFFSAQTPWTSIRFQEANIRDAQREFLLKLYNVLSFFNIYANIDGFQPGDQAAPGSRGARAGAGGTGWRPVAERCELDRWIASELHRTIRYVREKMDAFENYPAAGRLNEFVDALSNWYVRRSRERFWRGQKDQDKWDAYNTLYECLATLARLIAPFTPFFAETMYQNLAGSAGRTDPAAAAGARGAGPSSVHLCDYPVADEGLIDEELAQEMDLVRQIVSLGRAARTAARLKVRQPLALAEIILARPEHTDWLAGHSELIAEELNIKQVEFTAEADHYVTYQLKPDFKVIGPKFGQMAPQVAAALQAAAAAEVRRGLLATGEVALEVTGQRVRLTAEDVHIRLVARPGWSAAQGRAGVVVVKTELTPELKDEGLVRELIHKVQELRKERALSYTARITLYVQASQELQEIIRRFADTLASECLVAQTEFAPPPSGEMTTAKIECWEVGLAIEPR